MFPGPGGQGRLPAKKMRKLLLLLLVFLMALSGTAGATKSKFKDPSFDTRNVTRFNLAEAVHIGQAKQYHSEEAADAAQRAVNALRAALAKLQKTVITDGDSSVPAKYDLHLVVHGLGSYQQWHEPWDEKVTENKKVVGKDKHGKDVVVTVPVERIVHHPGYYSTVSYAEIELTVKDRETGKTFVTALTQEAGKAITAGWSTGSARISPMI